MGKEIRKCEVCSGTGFIIVGSNIRVFKREKKIRCSICKGKGVINIFIDPFGWNKFFNRGKDK